jgi:hypothetical protein
VGLSGVMIEKKAMDVKAKYEANRNFYDTNTNGQQVFITLPELYFTPKPA